MSEEVQHGPTSAGAVIADIGGGRGALILYVPEALAGALPEFKGCISLLSSK